MNIKLCKLTLAVLIAFTFKIQAQAPTYSPAVLGTPIFFDGFESWAGTPSQPTIWMQAPTTTLPASAVTQSAITASLTAEEGTKSCNLVNATTTYSYMATAATFSVTAGMAYEFSYYARGKGTIAVGVATGTVNTSPGGEAVSGKTWHQYKQSVIAPATATNAAFFIKVKGTGTYTSGGVTITGIDVDSFCVKPYTPVANVDLYSLQYTTLANGNSPFFGQAITHTGGIVTAVTLGNTGVNGYYVQTTGDTIWGAMLVYDYTSAALVHVGDSITFGGTVDEYYGMTQMSNITNFTNVSTTTGNQYPIPPKLLTTQTINNEIYEATLIKLEGVTVNSYTASYGQATITDVSGVPCLLDAKDEFYPPNGTATSGSAGNPGYQPTVGGTIYCFTGNVYYTFGFNIEPRDSADIIKNCTQTTGIKQVGTQRSDFNIYPNPAIDILNIEGFSGNSNTLLITDMLGYTINKIQLNADHVTINIADLAEGIYNIGLINNGTTINKKLIIVR